MRYAYAWQTVTGRIEMRITFGRIFLAILTIVLSGALAGAGDVVIKGVVTDSAGHPIRGVAVSAFSGIKTISRLTQTDGRYEIPVAAGTYDVAADAYGYPPACG